MYRSVLALLFASVLLAYFYVIDPTVQNRQGNDRGSPVSYTHLFRSACRSASSLPCTPARYWKNCSGV